MVQATRETEPKPAPFRVSGTAAALLQRTQVAMCTKLARFRGTSRPERRAIDTTGIIMVT
jgi:hypothetical protein